MSIINDALKKTQNTLGGKEEKPIIRSLSSAPLKENDRFSLLSILIVAVGFIGCVVVVILLLRPMNDQIPVAQALVEAELAEEVSSTPIAPVINTSRDLKGLTLNGVSTVDGTHIAVINNKIVNEGDSLGDKKVLSIDADAVKIYDNGEILILKMVP